MIFMEYLIFYELSIFCRVLNGLSKKNKAFRENTHCDKSSGISK